MEFTEVVTRRRMVRYFADEPVSAETVERMLNLARRGPSAGFTQGQDFVVVNDEARKLEIAELCDAEIQGRYSIVHRRVPSLCNP